GLCPLFFPSLPLTPGSFLWALFLPSKLKKRRTHISKERKPGQKSERNFLPTPPFPTTKKDTTENESAVLLLLNVRTSLWTARYSLVGPLFRSSSRYSYSF